MPKDEPKDEKKPEKPEAKSEKPAPKAEAKPAPARKIETKATGQFNTGRSEKVAYTHNRKSGQR